MKYTLSEINQIADNCIAYNVPENVLQIINDLASQVGSPNYIKTPVFKKVEKEKKKPQMRRKKVNEEWIKKPIFQTTKLNKGNETNKDENELRLQLNKLTDKNYNEIKLLIDKILETNEENMNIGSVIFELASGNRFYSETYARLYSEMAKKYENIKTQLKEHCEIYMDLFNKIEYVDANDNYEKFCEMNKNNEKRKSLSLFLVNLMKNNVITREEINEYLIQLLNKFDELLKTENKKNECGEICENFSLLYDENYDYSDYDLENGMTMNDYLGHLATTNVSNYKSYTNKIKFKIMDLCNL